MKWPDIPAANTLYASMPRTPLTGERKGDHYFRTKLESLQHPYTQFNRTWKGFVIRNTITIDIDEPMALEVFRDRAGFEPDLWVLNPGKGMSGHVSLVLPKAVFVPIGAKPRPWFQGIRREAWEVLMLLDEWLVAVCKADKAIVTQKTKTPGHPDHVTNRGERCGTSKLKTPQVYEIRAKLASGLTSVSIASEYNVSPRLIRKIRNRKCWAHLP